MNILFRAARRRAKYISVCVAARLTHADMLVFGKITNDV